MIAPPLPRGVKGLLTPFLTKTLYKKMMVFFEYVFCAVVIYDST